MSVDPSIKLLQERAWAYLEQHLDKVYTYHNAAHAMEVCAAVEEQKPLFKRDHGTQSGASYAL